MRSLMMGVEMEATNRMLVDRSPAGGSVPACRGVFGLLSLARLPCVAPDRAC